jgi:hypothetical protein
MAVNIVMDVDVTANRLALMICGDFAKQKGATFGNSAGLG